MRAFDAHWADAVSEIETEFGERVRIEPQTTSGTWRGRTGADPNRQPGEVVGRYNTKAAAAELEGNREGSKFQSMTRIAAATHVVRFSAGQVAALGYAPVAGDHVVLLDRPGAPRFTAIGVDEGAGQDLRLDLVTGAVEVAP